MKSIDWAMQKKKFSQHSMAVPLLSILALCILLLSACGTLTAAKESTVSPTPTPAIDSTLKNQGDTQLQAFQQWITLMQQYNGDVTTFQKEYTSDQQALASARTNAPYQAALKVLNAHVESIKIPAMKAESQNLAYQLQQEVTSWGQQHQYYDSFNNVNYPLGFEYGPNGIGGWIQDELNAAQTVGNYQQAIDDLNMYLTNFQAMMTNASDKTPYNQVHQTDLQLLQHYQMMNKKVIVISLQEQAMRVYQNGQLVKAFLVTTGRPELPSPPGTWWVEGKQSPTVFKAGVPSSSPDWYPDTPINYAIQYHSHGYFIHDSWWRADYGPGTNFPHADSSGDPFSSQGSHGCVNLAKGDAAWVYGFVQPYTNIVIY